MITGPEAALYLAPPVYNGHFSNRLGDPSVENPTWHIVQWGNPDPLGAVQDYASEPGAS